MTSANHIPADNFTAHFAEDFLDEAIAALTVSDVASLRRLETVAPTVAAPRSCTAYLNKRAVFAALLDASARNLRIFRRVHQTQPNAYKSRT